MSGGGGNFAARFISEPQGVEPGEEATMLRSIRNNRGATAIEYGLIAALIAVAAISAMSRLGAKISTTFNNVTTNMKAT